MTIVLRATGCFLGRVTLHDQREIGETELGYVLRPAARRKGYATEAASAFLSWGFENLPVPFITTMIAARERTVDQGRRAAWDDRTPGGHPIWQTSRCQIGRA